MTRINCVSVEDLSNKHLMAEYKEITRPFNKAYKRLLNNNIEFNNPDHYILNKGHETFFFDKLAWLYKRYYQLKTECLERGFNIDVEKFNTTCISIWFDLSSSSLWNDWTPTPQDKALNWARMVKRHDYDLVAEELAQ